MTALRIAMVLPALADFLLAGLTLMRLAGIEDDSVVPRLQFAGVAFAWGVMLLFALARPVERAWVLIPTALAVAGVSGAICIGYFANVVSAVSASSAVILALAIFGFSYKGLRYARHAASAHKSGARL